jgi:excisionase family DNA binding protein
MTTPDIKTRLTVRPNEAAALLGVSRRSIERAIRDGRLRSTRTIGGRLIVAADVLSLACVGVTNATL